MLGASGGSGGEGGTLHINMMVKFQFPRLTRFGFRAFQGFELCLSISSFLCCVIRLKGKPSGKKIVCA